MPFVQFERALLTGDPEVPVPAARPTCQLTLASDDETTAPALGERLVSCQVEVEFQHAVSERIPASRRVARGRRG